MISSSSIPKLSLSSRLSFSSLLSKKRNFSNCKSLKNFKIISKDDKSITFEGLLNNNNNNTNTNKQTTRFLNLFLRDACPTIESIDPSTSQKTFSTGEISLNISILEASITKSTSTSDSENLNSNNESQLNIKWSDNHNSVYPESLLRRYASYNNSRNFRYLDQPYISWETLSKEVREQQQQQQENTNDNTIPVDNIPTIDYNDYMNSDQSIYKAVKSLHDYGLVFVENIPNQEGIIQVPISGSGGSSMMMMGSSIEDNNNTSSSTKPDIAPGTPVLVEEIGKRIGGYIKETFYGTSWNVVSVPSAKNVAYTSVFLPLHMDLLYYESPPGVQLLHVIQNSATGGESIFADSFAAVNHIWETDKEAYLALTKVPITYHYDNDGYHYYYSRPLIIEDPNAQINNINGRPFLHVVNYSPPFQGPLDSTIATTNSNANEEQKKFSDSEIQSFHRGLKLFETYINDRSNQIEVKMKEGTCMLFMNRRILHARNQFDQASGSRWFRGTYLDLDAYQSKLRMMVRKFE